MQKEQNQVQKIFKTVLLTALLGFSVLKNVSAAVLYTAIPKGTLITIDLDKQSTYSINKENNILSITIDKETISALKTLSDTVPELLGKPSLSKDGHTISFPLSTLANINSYTQNNKLYLSINTKELSSYIPSKELKTAEISYRKIDDKSRFILRFDTLPNYKIKTSLKQTNIIFSNPFKLASKSLKKYSKAPQISFQTDERGQTTLTFPETLVNSYEQKNTIIIDTQSADEKKQSNIPSNAEDNIIAGSSNTSAPLKVSSLSFSWNMPTNIAVFKRNQYLWIVFDHPQNFDTERLSKEAGTLAKDIIQLPNNTAAIIRLTPEEDVNIHLRKEGLLWIVDLYSGRPAVNTKEFDLFTQYDMLNNAYLYVPSQYLNKTISFFDPEIGDIINATTTDQLSTGLKQDYTYPDIELKKSYTGLVSIFNSDDIIAETGNTGVAFRRQKKSLRISEDLDEQRRKNKLQQQVSTKENFFAPITQEMLSRPFNEIVTEQENNITAADSNNKDNSKLVLAIYYISKGLGTNALRILEELEKNKSPLLEQERFHSTKGIANFLARRYNEALKNFSFHGLENIDENKLWQQLINSALIPQAKDNAIINKYAHIIKAYPNEIQRRIALIAIEPAILAQEDLSIQSNIDIISRAENKADNLALINYYSARKVDILGYPLNAIRSYRDTAELNSPKYSALARYNIIRLQRNSRNIKVAEAIKEYEKLRFAWGDIEFKKKVLKDLSDAYTENKNYPKALETLLSLRNISNEKETEKITDQMIKIFENVYTRNQDNEMSTLKSLAMYNDYKWLAPLSSKHSEITQSVADRMVSVDLLDRAFDLLSEQFSKEDLSPQQRAGIGTRIALINLFKNRPSDALQILDASESINLPQTLQAYRRLIRAKALAAIGVPETALELISNDYSRNALLLKTEIYWNSEQWGNAADTIKYLIEKPTPNQKMTEEQMQLVLDWATTLKKAGRDTVIVRLRNTFKPYFEKTAYESAFNVLTDTFDADKISLNKINQVINNISAFSGFAEMYTQMLKTAPIGETDTTDNKTEENKTAQ